MSSERPGRRASRRPPSAAAARKDAGQGGTGPAGRSGAARRRKKKAAGAAKAASAPKATGAPKATRAARATKAAGGAKGARDGAKDARAGATGGASPTAASGKKKAAPRQKPARRQKPAANRRRAAPRKGAGRRRGSEREFSAGGVVVRRGKVVVIVPTRRAADGSRVLALPKGHVDPGETPVQAAAREVREETGVVGEPVHELGETRYWYRRDGLTIGKTVSFFLFTYVEGDIADHDDEVEEVRWIGFKEARKQLSHAAEREMVALAEDYLQKDR